ncbi:unnamed protein product, partial [Polarella glacialis]
MEGAGCSSSSSCVARDAAEAEEEAEAELHMRGLLQWLREESFVTAIAEWSWDWCLEFPREKFQDPSRPEHSLRFTEAHLGYRQLFESRAEQYLQLHGLHTDAFLRLAVEFLDARRVVRGSDDEDVLEGLIASESYPTFFLYMCSVRRRREWAEKTMCSATAL